MPYSITLLEALEVTQVWRPKRETARANPVLILPDRARPGA
jgi:hypothetical protein